MNDQELLLKKVDDLTRQVNSLQLALKQLTDITFVKSSRVQIDNFEGLFKIFPTVPSSANGLRNGTILLTADNKIVAIINGSVKSVALT